MGIHVRNSISGYYFLGGETDGWNITDKKRKGNDE